MTDKEIKDCSCDVHEDCDCTDECCAESNVITLELEDGPRDFEILSSLEHEGKTYLALSEVDSLEYDIFLMTEDGESVELSYVEDDDTYNAVADKFEEMFGEEYEELDQSLTK